MSGFYEYYRTLIFSEEVPEWFQCHGTAADDLLEDEVLTEDEAQVIQSMSKEQLLEEARKWQAAYKDSHQRRWQKVRKEDVKQKHRVATIEEHTCQVCGFYCEYLNSKGKIAHVVHVDHILEKSDGGDERLSNLWVLCPNCHAKKTAGVIEINMESFRSQKMENQEKFVTRICLLIS